MKLDLIEKILASGKLDDKTQKAFSDFLDDYNKTVRRTQRIIQKSDRMAKELHINNTRLAKLSDKLSKYLSPQVYEMIFSEDSNKITSKRKKLTIFFSDIVNFTATTEKLESEELTAILNDYLTQMSEIALEFGGTIDKYIGDAIVIFFGDPKSNGYREDAKNCVLMAISMQNKMKAIEKKYVDDGIVDSFQIRMGITTGYVTVGNFGSDERMDYTIIGGNVNLAARLESAAEPRNILISHETYSLVKDIIDVTKKVPIQVKGISKSIQTYRVDGEINSTNIKDLNSVVDSVKNMAEKEDLIAKLEDVIKRLKINKC